LGFPQSLEKFGVGMGGTKRFGFLFVFEPYVLSWSGAGSSANATAAFLTVGVVPFKNSTGKAVPELFCGLWVIVNEVCELVYYLV
jgi:hypothetical protein